MELFGPDEERKKPEVKEKKPDEKTERKAGLKVDGRDLKRALTAGSKADYVITVTNTGTKGDTAIVRLNLIYSTEKGDEAPEWAIKVVGVGNEEWDVSTTNVLEREVSIDKGAQKDIVLGIEAPKGIRYGDQLSVMVTVISKNDPAVSENVTATSVARQTIKAVKTSIGHERTVADSIFSKARTRNIGVFSVLAPATIKGYVFVETMNPDRLEEMVRDIRRARGVVKGETRIEEIDHFLTPKPTVSGIMEGDIVELVAGPFKGEKARVQQIDESKEEITVELFEAVVPIPITVRGDSVRILKKEKEET